MRRQTNVQIVSQLMYSLFEGTDEMWP